MPNFRSLDLRCPACDVITRDVILTREEPLPVCPTCQGERTENWSLPSGRTSSDNFTPIDLDGVHYATLSEWNEYLAEMKRAHPTREVRVETHSKAAARGRADEVRAGYYDRVKSHGIDEQSVRERHEERRRRREESR